MSCGATLLPLARWMHSALEYLDMPANVHAWSLQRTRKYTFDLLCRTTPSMLNHLSKEPGLHQSQRDALRPRAVLLRVAHILQVHSYIPHLTSYILHPMHLTGGYGAQ